MVDIILIGPPGSGKGTMAKIVAGEDNPFCYIENSSLLRAANNPDFEPYMSKGNLVPDEHVIPVWEKELKRLHAEGQHYRIHDGMGRTGHQAKIMVDKIKEVSDGLIIPVHIKLSRENCQKRLDYRATQENRADDQDTGIQKNRLNIYFNNIGDIENSFKSHHGIDVHEIEVNDINETKEANVARLRDCIRDKTCHLSLNI